MSINTPSAVLTIPVVAGVGEVDIGVGNIVDRTCFDGPDTATYDWLVKQASGKPITGRTLQAGDKIIIESYPVKPTFKFRIENADTDGSYEVTLWLRG